MEKFTLKIIYNRDLQTNITYMMRWFGKLKVSEYIKMLDEANKNKHINNI